MLLKIIKTTDNKYLWTTFKVDDEWKLDNKLIRRYTNWYFEFDRIEQDKDIIKLINSNYTVYLKILNNK